MKDKRSTQTKKEKRLPVKFEKKQFRAAIDPPELHRTIQQFDRAAPDRFVPELQLMTEEERNIYEHSNGN